MSAFAQFCKQYGLDPSTLSASDAVAIAKALSSSEGDGQDDEETAIQKAVEAVEAGKGGDDATGFAKFLKSIDHAASGIRALVGIGKAVEEADFEDDEEDEFADEGDLGLDDGMGLPGPAGDDDLDLDYEDDGAGLPGEDLEEDPEADIDAAIDAAGIPEDDEDDEEEEALARSLNGLKKSLEKQGFDGIVDGNELLNTIMDSYDQRDASRTGKLVKSINGLAKSFSAALGNIDERLTAIEEGHRRLGMIPAQAAVAPYSTVTKSTDAAAELDVNGVKVPEKTLGVERVRKSLGKGGITPVDVRTVEKAYDHGKYEIVANVLRRCAPEE